MFFEARFWMSEKRCLDASFATIASFFYPGELSLFAPGAAGATNGFARANHFFASSAEKVGGAGAK